MVGAQVSSSRSAASEANAESSGESARQRDSGLMLTGTVREGALDLSRDDMCASATTNPSPLVGNPLDNREVTGSGDGTTGERGVSGIVADASNSQSHLDQEMYASTLGQSGQEDFSEEAPAPFKGAAHNNESIGEHLDLVDDVPEGHTELRSFGQWGEEPRRPAKRSKRKQYVWPELRTAENEEPDYEYLEVDPSELPERRTSSQKASSSGRAIKYTAPKAKNRGQKSTASVKREPSAAAQACLTLLSEYQDPGYLPYEEFRDTLREWVNEQAPRRADGMDVLRALLDYRETQVFIRVAEHFMKEGWFRSNLADHNKLLNVFVKNGFFLKAENRYRKMLSKGIQPDRTTYTLMIQHYGLWKRPDRAEELFLEMKTRNIHPNEDTFVALMGALTKAGRLVEAERLLKSMRKSRCPRGPAAYVTLMEAYGREEEPEEAERVFLMLQADGIPLDRAAYLGLMHVYSDLRKPHHVERVFRDMLAQRILPDETSYLVLIDSYRAAGLGKNCERLMEEMKLLGLSPYKAAALIMEAYGKEQLFSEAERILTDLQATTGRKPGVMHYNALLASYGRHGLHKDAMKVFDWMTSAGVALNQRSHVLILDLFDRTGRKANLRAAFRAMQSDGFGLEFEVAQEAVNDYRASIAEYELEAEEEREERLRKRAERTARFMEKWDTWSRELDELDAEIAEVELAAERRMDKWADRTRTY
ncbi:putative Pentatricopeptide repeat domain containing protein [Klebsormidium nitens]|uniref:Putative Pentatricopeptide repeat domain containing protein n=1 Tax=Klebsormidium nitens TaxID=105231 RepID=A0A1Y1HZA3_KLENI|nr:putative Pentatricopeptide repeat domain containing protein [Klebsormidium nitens]|eukprot:GAQ83513.1 putative Pentatricopeptide repeat domain containing protein [Klebsormidium nitens]